MLPIQYCCLVIGSPAPSRQADAPLSLHLDIAEAVGDLFFARRSINARGRAERL
jgi:hypothetical protein